MRSSGKLPPNFAGFLNRRNSAANRQNLNSARFGEFRRLHFDFCRFSHRRNSGLKTHSNERFERRFRRSWAEGPLEINFAVFAGSFLLAAEAIQSMPTLFPIASLETAHQAHEADMPKSSLRAYTNKQRAASAMAEAPRPPILALDESSVSIGNLGAMKAKKSVILALVSVALGVATLSVWSARATADGPRYRVVEIGKAALPGVAFENLLNQEATQGYEFRTVTYYGNFAVFEHH